MSGWKNGESPKPPSPEEIKALKARHRLTYYQMAAPLYGVRPRQLADYGSGLHAMPPLVWWALVKEFDGVDLRGQAPEPQTRVIEGFQS